MRTTFSLHSLDDLFYTEYQHLAKTPFGILFVCVCLSVHICIFVFVEKKDSEQDGEMMVFGYICPSFIPLQG